MQPDGSISAKVGSGGQIEIQYRKKHDVKPIIAGTPNAANLQSMI